MKITTETIKKNADSGTVDLVQARISFDTLPLTAAEIRNIRRDDDNGRFVLIGLLICAYKTWKKDDEENCAAMMKELMNSPTVPASFSNFTKEAVRQRMLQNDKWQYIADAYFDGADCNNGYTPAKPFTITLREYPYLPQKSTIYGKQLLIEKIVTDFKGADSERSVSVYRDPDDHKWYIWSDTYITLLADIRKPA